MYCTPIPMERSVYFSLDLPSFTTQELRWILAGYPARESFFRKAGVALCVAAVDRRAAAPLPTRIGAGERNERINNQGIRRILRKQSNEVIHS